jgi:hypothetical protein
MEKSSSKVIGGANGGYEVSDCPDLKRDGVSKGVRC